MKKGLLLLLSLIWMVQATAQRKDYFRIEQGAAGTQSNYPKFYHKKAKKAAQQINAYLQLALQKTLIDPAPDSAAIQSWSFSTPINNQKILSVSAQSAAGVERHFLFNAATGSLISIQDIFTVNGIAYIKRQMLRYYQDQSKRNLLPAQLEGREKCFKADIQEFFITNDSLMIFPAHCTDTPSGDHMIRPGFSTAYLGQYLSEYGQVMFGIIKKPKLKKLQSNGVAGLYRGMIDQEEVILQLDAPFEKSLSGTIYFTGSKRSIPFDGSFKNNRMDINTNTERLSLSIYPGAITGQRKAGNKVLSNFTLNRQ